MDISPRQRERNRQNRAADLDKGHTYMLRREIEHAFEGIGADESTVDRFHSHARRYFSPAQQEAFDDAVRRADYAAIRGVVAAAAAVRDEISAAVKSNTSERRASARLAEIEKAQPYLNQAQVHAAMHDPRGDSNHRDFDPAFVRERENRIAATDFSFPQADVGIDMSAAYERG